MYNIGGKNMRVKSNKRAKLIAVLLVLVMLISVGYAFLSTQLTINGTATVKGNNWNIYFTNVQIKEGSIEATTAPTTEGTSTTELNWAVSMDTPGQFYEYNVDVVNGGTIDTMVATATNEIVTSTLTADQQKYLDYSIKYVNGADVEQYDKLAAGETKTITVKLVFKDDIEAADLPSTDQTGIELSYTANYVQADDNAQTKVTKNLEIGDTVNYTTSLNGVTLNNWKVFYVDGDYTYLIYGDYLQNSAISDDVKTTHNLSTNKTYCVYANNSRADLINAMTTKSNWNSLLTGTLNGQEVNLTQNDNVWAMGAPTLDLWVNSWNASYPSNTLYTATTASAMDDGLIGYYIGNKANPSLTYIDLSAKAGYNNTLYYPRKRVDNDCRGYWLNAASGANTYGPVFLLSVGYGGVVNGASYRGDYNAFRPVVRLPSSVVNQ